MPGREAELKTDKEQTIIDREDFRDKELDEEIIGKEKSDNYN
ncbi:conserved hypothetical protein (plasmid) [Borreliella finlandensis]|uniref:Uncharacterized protein n=1 Tax=Borreliella finlandensis TaxID=498741 RepID=A0A826GN03_9SPIR|nr:hypothetical protein [Borreliella finlandensis]EEH00295.1 conserved hypothetical protein [Borreliella finlandensis]